MKIEKKIVFDCFKAYMVHLLAITMENDVLPRQSIISISN